MNEANNAVEENPNFQHCNHTGSMEDQFYDLHPCQHYDKMNHPLGNVQNATNLHGEDSLWLDRSLVVIINNQKCISILPKN